MSLNTKLDRRHDINASERLPEKFSRVLDIEKYWDGIEKVLENESDPEALKRAQEAKTKVAMELAEKKAHIKVGSTVILQWNGVQFVKVEDIRDEAVKIGPCWYGFELVRKPSEHLLAMLEAEVGEGMI